MKKGLLFLLAGLIVVVMSGSAFAANSLNSGSKAISVGMGDNIFSHKAIPNVDAVINDVVDISGRFMVSNDVALYGGFGLQTDGGDADGTYLSLTVGFRKYTKVADLAPFVAAQLSYITVKSDPNIVDLSVIDAACLFGAEYFLGAQFSFEGAVGVGIGQYSNDLNNADDTYFGTRTVGVRANFYF
ncbi:MAG: hypothetical protein OEW15_00195 [Nitrospirota bacterium]|nr:hypothetical protein [Nitrospirota bacterium]